MHCKREISKMKRRVYRMNNKLIVSDPDIMMGKPTVAGTRITVEQILEKMASGETICTNT